MTLILGLYYLGMGNYLVGVLLTIWFILGFIFCFNPYIFSKTPEPSDWYRELTINRKILFWISFIGIFSPGPL